MVVGAFPAAKLVLLVIRQLSKPVANYIKGRAKTHPFVRKYICIPPAQIYNWCEIKCKMYFMNLGKSVNVPPLNEAMAIELGAEILGETILFIVPAAGLIYEYNRQKTKEALQIEQKEQEMMALHGKITDLSFQVETQKAQIQQLSRLVYDIDSRVVKVPWTGRKLPLPEERPEVKPEGETNKGVVLRAISYIENDLFRDSNKKKLSKSV